MVMPLLFGNSPNKMFLNCSLVIRIDTAIVFVIVLYLVNRVCIVVFLELIEYAFVHHAILPLAYKNPSITQPRYSMTIPQAILYLS